MKFLFIPMLALAGQMITSQAKDVVHLRPKSDAIEGAFAGKLVELINAPPVVYLPATPPKPDATGKLWTVDIKNLGPGAVTLTGRKTFTQVLRPGETVHVTSNSNSYTVRH